MKRKKAPQMIDVPVEHIPAIDKMAKERGVSREEMVNILILERLPGYLRSFRKEKQLSTIDDFLDHMSPRRKL